MVNSNVFSVISEETTEKVPISKDCAYQGAVEGSLYEDKDLGLAGLWHHQGAKFTAPSEPSPAWGSQA